VSAARVCPAHGAAYDDAMFCEVCGRNLITGALPAPRPVPTAARPTSDAHASGPTLSGSSANEPPVIEPPVIEPPVIEPPGAGAPDLDRPGRPPRTDAAGGTGVPMADLDWLSARADGVVCAGCGAAGDPAGGWCDECGRRLSAGRDRAELVLDGVAAVTDRARRRTNEDAVAIGRAGPVRVAVVCDGISSARRADTAATEAAEAGVTALLAALAGGSDGPAATRHAAAVAAKAAAGTGRAEDGDAPPGCTYVSAVLAADGVTVGWIGDSRAYWIGADGDARQLTVDDSPAAIRAAGRTVPDGLMDADPLSRALVRWLGADADEVAAQVVRVPPGPAGLVIVCSDGLSHYLPGAADLAAAVARHPGATPLGLAAELTSLAISAGGHDNIAVAVLPVAAARAGAAAGTERSA
jgi:PPM family protein phosphatase